MESPAEFDRVAQLAARRFAEQVRQGLADDFDALPLSWKLAASHEALLCSVSHAAINCHHTSTKLFSGAPFRVNRLHRAITG